MGTWTFHRLAVINTTALLALATIPGAQAGVGATVATDSTVFMREANERPEFLMDLTLRPRGEFESKYVEGKAEIGTRFYVNNLASFSVDIPDAYIATQKDLLGQGKHQLTFGRRNMEWSALEHGMNNMFSVWSPRFGWNPYDPKQNGLTGLFYTYKHPKIQFMGFATPIGVPEFGAPAGSPWVTPMPNTVEAFGQNIPLRIDMSQVDYAAVIVRPGAAVSLRYGEETGPWVRANYGVVPSISYATNAGVIAKLNPINNAIEATAYVRSVHDQMVTFEAGWKNELWSTWVAAHHVAPIFVSTPPPSTIMSPIGNGTVMGIGGEVNLKEGLTLQTGLAGAWEVREPPQSKDISMDMGGRYGYNSLFILKAKYRTEASRFTYGGGWLFDIGNLSQMFSVDAGVNIGARKPGRIDGPFHVGIGADFIATETGKGSIGQWEGNDLLRAKVAYFF
jgi:hypothetical protein